MKHREPLAKHHETILKHCETLKKCEKSCNTLHSMRRYRRDDIRARRRVSGGCGVGIAAQMCNRVTNHGDMPVWKKYSYLHD